jgi:predicted dehydrogenase
MANDNNYPARWVVIGNGNQGSKHVSALGSACIAIVDQNSTDKGLAALMLVPKDSYDAIAVCTPEDAKRSYIDFGIQHRKFVLVEKPLEIDESDLANFGVLIDGGWRIQTAYDHMFDEGVSKFISRAKQILHAEPSWSSLKLNYSFGTEELIKNSVWMDFGTGPWELVAPHILKILLEIQPQADLDFDFSFGFSQLDSPSTVVATHSGKHFVQLTTSYTSWKNKFHLELSWPEGSLELGGLTKWGTSCLLEYKRVLPAGAPTEVTRVINQPRTPAQAVEIMYSNVFKSGLTASLSVDSKISSALRLAREKLLKWDHTPKPKIGTS